MELTEIGLSNPEITKLNKKGFFTVEDVQRFLPRTYYDFSKAKALDKSFSGEYCAVVGTFEKMETKKTNNTLMLKAKVIDDETGQRLHVMWIGAFFMKNIITNMVDRKVVVCGKLTYEDEYRSFHMLNPITFSTLIEKNLKVYPVYKKMSGISEDWMQKIIERAMAKDITETRSEDLLSKYKLFPIRKALTTLHKPQSMEDVNNAQKRLVFDTLYDFAVSLEERNRQVSKGSVYNIKTTEMLNQYKSLLPFTMTNSQQKAVDDMVALGKDGRRINALVQGDVGSGKTAVAFSMMFAFAGSGYQSVLMAPTEILAKQHYEEIKKYADQIGVTTAFLTGSLKASEKKEILKGIQNGSIQIIVGTHSAASENVEYNDLALAVVDEEHRFGTGIEETLFSKSEKGMHTITMSATPIPRTIADVIFSGSILVYDLERPSGRQEVQTAIFNNDEKIYEFLEKQIKDGRQAYVVCPLIEKSNLDSRKNILSVAQVEDNYKKRFEMSHIKVTSVTGKTKKEDAEAILESFKNGDIDILISTTVIEVGVNNPNVSTIIISNAEMFGVAQLHQLRGRVGRGGYKGYCILKSAERENERLKLICSTTNGFELAEKDAMLRGPGDILGEKQSGKNQEIELVLKYPNMYKVIQKEVISRYA